MDLDLLLTLGGVTLAIGGFFWTLKASVDRNTAAINSLKGALIKNEERMVAAMKEAAERSGKEHDALLAAIDRFAVQQTERHEKLLDAMNRDHRDIDHKVGEIAQTAVKIDAKLDAHVGEDRTR